MRSSVAALVAACCVGFALALPRLRAQPSHGRQVYDAHCVECHGAEGHGDGPAASMLKPRPRDLTSGKFKLRTTESGSGATDDDLIQTVRRGMYGTSMPGWDGILPDGDIKDVVSYVRSLAPPGPTPVSIPDTPSIPSSAESIDRGRRAYDRLQCGKCHGSDGQGAGAVRTTFEDDWNQPLDAANLAEPWTFRGGSTARDIYLRFRTGMSGTPMPSFKEAASDGELWDLANYVVSLARTPVWSMNAGDVAAFYAKRDAEAKKNPAKHGEYLVDTIGCALCHSAYDAQKRLLPGMRLAGGMLIRIEPFGDYPAGNLTSDRETGLGAWTDAEIARTITKGILRDGTRLLPFPMDWGSYSTMTPDDINAIVAYLRTVPPVYNKVPKPSRAALPAFLVGKFRMLILGQDLPIVFFPGNAGATRGGRP